MHLQSQNYIITTTQGNLNEFDVISHNIKTGQQLVVEKIIENNKYEVKIFSNNLENLDEEYVEGVICARMFNVLTRKGEKQSSDFIIIKELKINDNRS